MKYNLITPVDLSPPPNFYELAVARIMAKLARSDVKFVRRGSNTTPDIYIVKTRRYWEIKNIEGNGKRTIQNNLRKASGQSKNIIISLLKPKCKMSTLTAIGRIKTELNRANDIKRIILITKDQETIALK
ncbi:MAG: hypothetical protein LBM73_02150 [Candidatus Nomurabacteria bacterium]|nr:hypothetical protein [Candidatus Nomurabacteria bacterium]